MKTKLFLFSLALLGISGIAYSQEHAMQLQLENIPNQNESFTRKQNKVKSVDEITNVSRTHREFDRNGNPLSAEVYFKDQLLLTTGFTYNNNGKALEKKMEDASGNTTMIVSCSYDKNGFITQETSTPANNETQKTQWFYTENGNIVREIRDVYLYSQTFNYEYNAEGKRIKTVETNSEYEDIQWISLFEYNTSGQKVKQKWFRTDKADTSFCYAKYDSQGNVIELNVLDQLTESMQIYTWSTKGQLLKKQEWFKFSGQEYKTEADYTEERQFDTSGNLIKTISTETLDKRVTVVDFVYGFYDGN